MRELYWPYQIKRGENPHQDILHVHDPNNMTLLRMHQPGQHGDDLSALRPVIGEGKQLQATRSGFAIGKNGIRYRITTPIQDGEGHLGMLEMGVNIAYFTERLARIFGVQVATIVDAPAMEACLSLTGRIEQVLLGSRRSGQYLASSTGLLPSLSHYCLWVKMQKGACAPFCLAASSCLRQSGSRGSADDWPGQRRTSAQTPGRCTGSQRRRPAGPCHRPCPATAAVPVPGTPAPGRST